MSIISLHLRIHGSPIGTAQRIVRMRPATYVYASLLERWWEVREPWLTHMPGREEVTTACELFLTPPSMTPWGHRVDGEVLTPGMWRVDCGNIAGYWLHPVLWTSLPLALQTTAFSKDGWYEGVRDWAMPLVYYRNLLITSQPLLLQAAETILNYDHQLRTARKLLQRVH